MNLMGLGYNFIGKDKNLTKTALNIQKEIYGLDKAIGDLNQSVSKGGGLGEMFKGMMKLPDIKGMANEMVNLAGDYKITTTNLEAHVVASDKAFRKASAGMNLSAKDSKKWQKTVTNVAYKLNVDVGAVTESFKALQQSGIDLEKIGLKNFETFQKFVDVTGIDPKQFTASIVYLKDTVGLTNDEVKDFLETTITIGNKFNMGTEAVASMSAVVQNLQQENAKMFAQWGPKRTKRFLEGTQLVAAAFLKSGKTAEEAQAAAQHLMGVLVQGQGAFADMFGGLQNSMGDFGEVLATNFGSAEQAFQLLQESPDQFISKMYETVDTIRKMKTDKILADAFGGAKLEDLNEQQRASFEAMLGADMQQTVGRMAGQFQNVLGPAATDLITRGLGPMGDQFKNLSAELSKPGGLADKNGAAIKMAKNFRTGLTAQEELTRAQDRFQTSLKRMAGMNDWAFLKKYNESVKLAHGSLAELGKDTGPKGFIFRALVGLKNYGFGGMLSQIHPLGPAVADLLKSFGPVIQQAGQFLQTMTLLASPMTLIIGGLALFVAYSKDMTVAGKKVRPMIDGLIATLSKFAKKIGAFIADMMPKVVDTIKSFMEAIPGYIKKIPFAPIGKAIGQLIISAFKMIVDLIGPITKMLVETMKGAFAALAAVDWRSVASSLVEVGIAIFDAIAYGIAEAFKALGWIISAVANINWQAVGQVVADFSKKAFEMIIPALWTVLEKIPGMIKSVFLGAIKVVFSIFDGLGNYLKEKFPKWVGVINAAITAMKVIFVGVVGVMIAYYGALATAAVASFVAQKIAAITEFLIIKSFVLLSFLEMIAGAVAAGAAIVIALAPILVPIMAVVAAAALIIKYWEPIKKFFSNLFGGLVDLIKRYVGWLLKLFTDPIGAIKDAWNSLKEWVGGAVEWVGGVVDDVSSWIVDVFTDTDDAAKKVKRGVQRSAEEIAASIDRFKKKIEEQFVASVKFMQEQASFAIKKVDEFVNPSVKKIEGAFQLTQDGMVKVTNSFHAQTEQMFKKYEGDSLEAITKISNGLETQMANELSILSKRTDLNEQQLLEERASIVKHYEEKRKLLENAVNANNGFLMAVNEQQRKQGIAAIEGFAKDSLKITEQTAKAGNDIVAQAAAEQGMSVESASSLMEHLAGTNPKKFKANIAIIKGVYLDFLNDSLVKTTQITKDAREAFQQFMKFSDKHWKDEKSKINEFTKTMTLAIDKFWAGILLKFETNMYLLGMNMSTAFEKVKQQFSNVNILEAIAGQDKVYEWARMVAVALYEALSAKDPFTAAIQNYANNSKAMLESLVNETKNLDANTARPAQPDAQPAGYAEQVAKTELLKAINDPFWTREAMEYWKNTSNSIAAIADAVSAKPAKKPEKKEARDLNSKNLEPH